VLCSDKNEAMVRITLPDDPSVLAARYAEFLPSEAELTERVRQDREDFERALRLSKEERAPVARARSSTTRRRSPRR
jgi:hypothetical protein